MRSRPTIALVALGMAVTLAALFLTGRVAPVYAGPSCLSANCTFYDSDGTMKRGKCAVMADVSACGCTVPGVIQQQSACNGPGQNQP